MAAFLLALLTPTPPAYYWAVVLVVSVGVLTPRTGSYVQAPNRQNWAWPGPAVPAPRPPLLDLRQLLRSQVHGCFVPTPKPSQTPNPRQGRGKHAPHTKSSAQKWDLDPVLWPVFRGEGPESDRQRQD